MAGSAYKKFKELSPKSLFEKEEEVLAFWKKNQIFKKSLERNPKSKIFSFYDGPPFITGLPHYATLLPSIAKDIIPRYQTMKGRYVPRVWGWDVHGLPAEQKVEEQLGLKVKKDIETFGVGNFIEAAREYVAKGSAQWRWYIDHIGRWADMDHPYRTDDLGYMETVIWIFKQLYDQGLIYKGRRVSLYCPRCATPLSKFEVTMDAAENYKNVEDPGVTISFKLKDEKDTYILAWTTTPWTLPANNGLAVNPKIKYVTITDGAKKYILAKEALARYSEFKTWKILKTQSGKEMAGKSFEPLFEPIFTPDYQKDFKVWSASFPTTDEGTGIVHIAPAFGEDDFNLGQAKKLSAPMILDDDGKFKKSLPFPWAGVYFKKADGAITEALKEKGLLIRSERITHAYPHCYRCATPLIYMAQDAWFMKIDPLRKQMLKTNEQINWVPGHFGKKRFKYNIENAPDWSLSRARYWGTPMPIWETADGERIVVGSLAEIEKLSGKKIKDLHRPGIDEVVLTTPSGKKAYRVKEILDVWFESGAMPYAQDHYPFENKKAFENGFPTDFIIEYTGQLRGWFYTLHVLATALKKKPAFKNVVVSGVLMGTDGRKMSKSYGNYPDPKLVLEKHGAESLRLYFMSNKIMQGEDLDLNERDIQEARNSINILHNSFKYFTTYANLHKWRPGAKNVVSNHILDRWIRARLEQCIGEYASGLDNFDFPASTRPLAPFIEDLSTWYIRRSRDRFVDGDTKALSTLYEVLLKFSKAIAPTLPFSAEQIFGSLRGVKDPESVHLCDYPKSDKTFVTKNKLLLERMQIIRNLSSLTHNLRSEAKQPLRQKMASVVIKGSKGIKTDKELISLLREEVNVLEVKFDTPINKNFLKTKMGEVTIGLDQKLTPALEKEGLLRELLRELQDARKKHGLMVGQKANLAYNTIDIALSELIETNKKEIASAGNFIKIERETIKGESVMGGRLEIKITV
ncbi:MAG: isoleucine--tRNA ligase [Candidatus Colwellbacteria bacterium]|nr:isoleucine--tRNA ligase [Candidatus Colwellbacteria bacterium]